MQRSSYRCDGCHLITDEPHSLEACVTFLQKRLDYYRATLERIRDRDVEWFNLPLQTQATLMRDNGDSLLIDLELEAAAKIADSCLQGGVNHAGTDQAPEVQMG